MGTAPGWRFHSPDRRHCVLGREETAGAQLAESPQGQVGAKCFPQVSRRLWNSALLTPVKRGNWLYLGLRVVKPDGVDPEGMVEGKSPNVRGFIIF